MVEFQHDNDNITFCKIYLFVVSECFSLPAWDSCGRHVRPLQVTEDDMAGRIGEIMHVEGRRGV